jgi:hypothetical protein
MKKHILLVATFLIFSFLPLSCIPNLFKNNDSIPSGYEKINFSAYNNPSELIRDSLDQSNSTILSLNNIFPNYSSNIIQQMNLFINNNKSLNLILNESIFSSIVNKLPSFPDPNTLLNAINLLNSSSFILTATPTNTLDPKVQSDSSNIFTKITGTPIQVNALNGIQFIDNNGNNISSSNITAKYTINTYYIKNFYQSWSFPLNNTNNTNSTWEFMVQCVKANLTILGDTNTYNIPPWPRISIILLNPNTTITDKYILIKNTLKYNSINQPTFIPIGNISQRTQRAYNSISNGFAPQSLIFNSLTQIQSQNTPLTGGNYIYFQDGMTSFFSRLLASYLTQKNMINSFASWQILVNKSWFDITRTLDSSYNIPTFTGNIPVNFLSAQNIPVNISYSKDFQPGGIHYIDPTDTTDFLPQIPNILDATSIGLDETTLTTVCSNIMN